MQLNLSSSTSNMSGWQSEALAAYEQTKYQTMYQMLYQDRVPANKHSNHKFAVSEHVIQASKKSLEPAPGEQFLGSQDR